MRFELIRPIAELIRGHAAGRGEAVAFEDASRAVTYRVLDQRTANLAGHLQTLGIEPGSAVAFMLPNSVDWIETCLAIARAGGVAVPISYDSVPDEIAYRLADADCRIAVTTDQRADALAAMREDAEIIGTSRLESLLATPAPAPPRDPDALDATRFIIYTSGTTGRAKGVMLTERGMLWMAACCWGPVAGLSEQDVVLSPLPLFHSYGLNLCVLSVLAIGAREFIMERFSVRDALAQLEPGRFTVMPGVPTMFHYLLSAARERGRPQTGRLRLCISAGAIMPGPLNQEFEAVFGVPLIDGYGITETSTMVTLNWPAGERAMGSCGVPLSGVAVRLIDPLTGKDAATGQEGELTVRGPNLMQGYHKKPQETASALRDGWYHTGDLARSDPNGRLTITGRLKELIIRGGQNIAPAEVEQVLAAHPAVLDCAVVGIAHEHLGEVPVAFVVARPGAAPDEPALLDHCRAHLSAYKVPASVVPIEEIPRTGSGKIMRFRLRERYDGLG